MVVVPADGDDAWRCRSVSATEVADSHSVNERKTPLGWVPRVALLLLLGLLALMWLLISN